MQRRHLIVGAAAAAVLLLAALVGVYFASPYMALGALRTAMQNHDRDRLEELVDFPSVRENLKTDLKAVMARRMAEDPEMKDNPFAGLALMMAPALVDRMVEAAVTPEGLARISAEGADVEVGGGSGASEAKSGKAKAGPKRKVRGAYAGLNRFRVEQPLDKGEKVTWVLRRQGLFGWRLVRVELPVDALSEAGKAG
jgi:hypothetical protein